MPSIATQAGPLIAASGYYGRASGGATWLGGLPSAPCKRVAKKGQLSDPLDKPVIGNALIITVAILIALAFWLMDQLRFLIPYKHVLVDQYGDVLLLCFVVLSANVFFAVYVAQRKFLLKDTGRKLSHLDKQTVTGEAPMPNPVDSIDKESV
jgi:hypothetical protein